MESKEESPHEELPSSDIGKNTKISKLNVAKLILIGLSFSSLGMFNGVVGTTLPYLRDRIHVTFAEIGQLLALRAIGKLFGSILGGLALYRFPKHAELNFACFLTVEAVCVAIIPWCQNLAVMTLVFFIQGMPAGSRSPGFRAVAISILGTKTGPFLTSCGMMIYVGDFLSPQLVNAFIQTLDIKIDNLADMLQNGTINMNVSSDNRDASTTIADISGSSQDTEQIIIADIEYPYAIYAGILLCFAIGFLILFRLDAAEGGHSEHVNEHTAGIESLSFLGGISKWLSQLSCKADTLVFGVAVFSFGVITMTTFEIRFVTVNYLYSTLSEGRFALSPSESANIATFFGVLMLAGSGLNAIASYFFHEELPFTINLVSSLIVSIMLATWGRGDQTVFTVLILALAFFIGPLNDLSVAVGNLYVKMTIQVLTVISILESPFGAFYNWLLGYLFETVEPFVLFDVLLGTFICLFIVYLVAHTVGKIHRRNTRIYQYNEIK